MNESIHTLTAKELAERFRAGIYSAEHIVKTFLERIDRFNPKIGAFLTVYHDKALEKAKHLDRKKKEGQPLGKLAAVPIALKDNIHIKGEITTCGSKFLTNYRAVFDATVTELLEMEDAIFIGKTNLDEFAMGSSTENSALQETSNPWDLNCVPGGSSGGSAVAVAARLCPLAFGSDTGGSIRQPASMCGILGMKPSYGRISRYGLVAFGSSLDQIGPFATSCEDIALTLEILGKHDHRDATSLLGHSENYSCALQEDIRGKRIGVPFSFLETLNPAAKLHFEGSLNLLKTLGAEIIPIDLGILKYSVPTYYIIATAEASTNLARFDGIRYGVRAEDAKTLDEVYDKSRHEGFGPEVKKRILLGTYVLSSGYKDAYYKKAAKVRLKIIDTLNQAFENCDVVVTPTTPTPCFQKKAIQDPLQMYLQDIYTIAANLARLPAISVPSGFDKTGLPLGLQIMGAYKEDMPMLSIAAAFEKATQHNKRIPQGFE